MDSTDPLPTQRFGRAVRQRRRELGLTQQELARFAGCGLAFLYDLERGKASVRLDKVLDVLAVLGLELRVEDGTGGLVVGPAALRPPEET
jgi:y4mF family transcriptional regulator